MQLVNKVVVVTGSTSGIGHELTKKLLVAGNRVIACGRNKSVLHQLQQEFPSCAPVMGDLTSLECLTDIKKSVIDHGGELDILFNVAGVQYYYDFMLDEATPEKVREEVDINFTAQLQLIYTLLPFLMKAQSGAIVNVTSCLAVVPKQSAPVYCATKAALRCFTRALRYQLENTRVKLIEVVPALVDTPMIAGRRVKKMPVGDFVDKMLVGVASNQLEVRVGKAKLLLFLHRWVPSIAYKILKKA
jgi:short-subunit dehydrogenase involved in D-alanine esterification of teichoic acids